MKALIPTVIILAVSFNAHGIVTWGATWVKPKTEEGGCSPKEYAEVGFFTIMEVNNASFQIQRSKDPKFSSAITGTGQFNGNFSGCGTCGESRYTVTDYGPFAPNEVWYYRVKATSNWGKDSYKELGSYTVRVPTTVNWINQVTHTVLTGSSPATESSYVWGQETRDTQGVKISLMPTEVAKVYLEQGNNTIHFVMHPSVALVSLDVSVDHAGFANVYNGAAVGSRVWDDSAGAFTSLGEHNLKVKFTSLDGTVYLREYRVYVVPKSDALYRDNYCNTMRVWKGSNPGDPKLLILSEGFDSYNSKAEQYYRHAGRDLINCLLNKGFDVYVVNYNLNAQSIKNNAAVFQSAIRYMSAINGGRPVVATGMSMGGVINRLACAKAEHEGNPLPIAQFVTLDAPHQGAHISPSFQDWRKEKVDEAAQAGSPDTFAEFASNNDAAKELLNYNAYDLSGSVHAGFFSYLNSLNGDGYPHLMEKIGIAFSTDVPNSAMGQWIYVHLVNAPNFGGKHNFNGYLSGDDLLPGSYLPPINIDDFAATVPNYLKSFGLSVLRPISDPWVTVTQYEKPTFIPHASALDIVNGTSKFDKTILPSVTGDHDVVPGDIVGRIVNALIGNVYIQNRVYDKPVARTIAGERIFAGRNVIPAVPPGDVIIKPPARITFKASTEIRLSNGFVALPGSEFSALIGTINDYLECQ